jgi:hypothetical protein
MAGCCCGTSGCCTSKNENKQLNIDFLYLDLSVCERCQGTDKNLEEAIREVSGVLKAAGFTVAVNKVNITSKELAEKYEFLSSPTIRMNGKDIALEVKESACKDCGDLCGENVDCRVWTYDGIDYDEPPKELIINAILKEVYSEKADASVGKTKYVLPENLRLFFEGKNK